MYIRLYIYTYIVYISTSMKAYGFLQRGQQYRSDLLWELSGNLCAISIHSFKLSTSQNAVVGYL